MTALPPESLPGEAVPTQAPAPPRGVWAWVAGRLVPVAAAWQFLTVAPPVVRRRFTDDEMGRSVACYPAVGLAIGAVLAGLDAAFHRTLPPGVGAAGLLIAWVLITGGLHLDGLLDACDGLFGGRTPEDRLRILRDERVGAFAVIGGVLLMVTKYATLAETHRRAGALVLAPTLGRWVIAVAVTAYPYARGTGLGRSVKDHAGPREGMIATLTAVAVAAAFGGPGLAAFGAAAVAGWLVVRSGMSRLGGLTGDVYGAACEVAEAAVLLAWSACETVSS